MLLAIAQQLHTDPRRRHLLFLSAASLAILLIGYHFGTFDQTIHIPFLRKFANPALYPGDDAFFDQRFQHYSFFWFLFLPFYQWGVLEPAMFAAHFAATYLTFWAAWRLCDALFADPLANLILVVALVIPHIGFSSFPIIEFSLLNRTAVLPFLLMAMELFLRRRHVLAFGLLGVLFNFHVLSAAYVLAVFGLAMLLELRQIGWRTAVLAGAAFAAAAAPLLIWRALSPPVVLAPQPDWFAIVSLGLFYHLFYLIGPYPHILLVTLSGLSALALFLIAWRRRPAPPYDRAAAAFVFGALLIVVLQAMLTQTWPLTVVAQAQIMRAGLLALIVGYIYFAGYLAARYRAGALRGGDFGWQAAAFITSVLPITPLVVWLIQRWSAVGRWRHALAALTFVGSWLATLLIAWQYAIWSPGIHLYVRPTPWHAAQAWARDHTPADAAFVTPMHLWWFYDADWRVFSERRQVAALSDVLEIALVPDYLETWRGRFESLAPGVIARFAGDPFANRRMTAEAYYQLTDAALLRAAREHDAGYVVVEKPHTRPWPVAYENEAFVIYDLNGLPAPP